MMAEPHVFVSVGSTANDTQEAFVRAVEDRLRTEGLIPHTVGRNTFSSDSPFKAVTELMNRCSGVVVIAFERLHVAQGSEKRGGPKESTLSDVKIATAWNQIEAAMAYCRGFPLLVLVEEGLRADGLLEKGLDWYVQTVKVDPSSLHTQVFNGVLADWKEKLGARAKRSTDATPNPGDLTVAQLLGALKPAQLWSALAALAGLIAAAFALGAKLIGG
jgi:hypothetical protein